jgi:chemotaxis signal transduction protein
MTTVRLIRCAAGSDTFCIDSDWVDSIQAAENLYPNRSTAGSIGWIRRFDEQVPVFRLADQIHGGVSAAPSTQGVVLSLRRGDRCWGFLVDKVLGASDVAKEHLFPLPSLLSTGPAFPCVVVDQEGPTLLVAPERLVPTEVSGVLRPDPTIAVKAALAASASASRAPVTAPPPAAPSHLQMLTFSLPRLQSQGYPVRFGISTAQAVEIMSSLPMVRIPHAAPFIAGMAAWRGLPVPVIHIGGWLGMGPGQATPGSRLLLCRCTTTYAGRGAGLVALADVDDLHKVDLPIDYTSWPEAVDWNSSLTHGIYQSERGMLVLPNLDPILHFEGPLPTYLM